MWTVTIYGCDTDTTGDMPSKATVEGLASVVSVDVEMLGAYPIVPLYGENKEYSDTADLGLKDYRYGFEVRKSAEPFPTSGTTIESFFKLAPLTKEYKWLWFNDYPLYPTGCDSTKVLAVSYQDISPEPGEGYYNVTYKLTSRKTKLHMT